MSNFFMNHICSTVLQWLKCKKYFLLILMFIPLTYITNRLKVQNGFTYISQWGTDYNSIQDSYISSSLHVSISHYKMWIKDSQWPHSQAKKEPHKEVKKKQMQLTICGLLSTAHVKKQPSLYCSSHSSFLYDTRVSILWICITQANTSHQL